MHKILVVLSLLSLVTSCKPEDVDELSESGTPVTMCCYRSGTVEEYFGDEAGGDFFKSSCEMDIFGVGQLLRASCDTKGTLGGYCKVADEWKLHYKPGNYTLDSAKVNCPKNLVDDIAGVWVDE